MSMEIAKEYLACANQKKDLEGQINTLKARMGFLEPQLTDYFALQGLQNLRLDGGQLVLTKDVVSNFIADDDHEEAFAAFREAGLGYLVKEGINAQSLKGYVREVEKNDEEIPEGIRPFIHVYEMYRLRVRA